MACIVQVLVRTKASCVTSVAGAGSAQGCAHVKTSEADFEDALADTHAEAVAAALERHCSCAKKWKWKFGDAEEFHEILATAYAGADVSVCASGVPPAGARMPAAAVALGSQRMCMFCGALRAVTALRLRMGYYVLLYIWRSGCEARCLR